MNLRSERRRQEGAVQGGRASLAEPKGTKTWDRWEGPSL